LFNFKTLYIYIYMCILYIPKEHKNPFGIPLFFPSPASPDCCTRGYMRLSVRVGVCVSIIYHKLYREKKNGGIRLRTTYACGIFSRRTVFHIHYMILLRSYYIVICIYYVVVQIVSLNLTFSMSLIFSAIYQDTPPRI